MTILYIIVFFMFLDLYTKSNNLARRVRHLENKRRP